VKPNSIDGRPELDVIIYPLVRVQTLLLVVVILAPTLALCPAHPVAANGHSVRVGAGALVATSSTVVHILAHIGLASILLLAVAILPSRGASVSALASRAGGNAVGVGGAAHTAASAIVHIVAHIGFASILTVGVAILPAVAALGAAVAT